MATSLSFTTESTTPLAGSASKTGAPLLAIGFTRLRGTAASDQGGTLNIDQSPDGTTWFNTTSVAVSGSAASPQAATVLESIVAMPYARVRYVNGATVQANFTLTSALVP